MKVITSLSIWTSLAALHDPLRDTHHLFDPKLHGEKLLWKFFWPTPLILALQLLVTFSFTFFMFTAANESDATVNDSLKLDKIKSAKCPSGRKI